MARLDELDLPVGAVEGPEHAVDAVAGVAVDPPDTPGVKPLDEEIANGLGHLSAPMHKGERREGCRRPLAKHIVP